MLTFDNSSQFLDIDSQEVQVGRRLYRSGESEYLINKAPARLKDVRDLLMGSGAGSAAYSIIEQGRVDQLLQSSTVNRRAVFEEAAGISRFKARKVDAQRKLDRVGQNLLRLTDIVEELDGRLNTMRNQAQKATRYRKYSTELRELRIGYSADEYRELQQQILSVDDSEDNWQAEIDRLAAESEEIEQRQAALESQLTEVEDRYQESQSEVATNREAIAGYEVTIQHLSTRQSELTSELDRLWGQQSTLEGRSRDIAGELQKAEVTLQEFEENYNRRVESLTTREAEITELSKKARPESSRTGSDSKSLIGIEAKNRSARWSLVHV